MTVDLQQGLENGLEPAGGIHAERRIQYLRWKQWYAETAAQASEAVISVAIHTLADWEQPGLLSLGAMAVHRSQAGATQYASDTCPHSHKGGIRLVVHPTEHSAEQANEAGIPYQGRTWPGLR